MFPQGFKRNYSGVKNTGETGVRRGLIVWLALALVLALLFKFADDVLIGSASAETPVELYGYQGLVRGT